MSLRALLSVCALLGVTAIVAPARADHHEVRITEVFMGTGGAENADFVELKTLSPGQDNFVDNGAKVKVYDASGILEATATFTSDPNNASTAQKSILVATTEAESFFGVTADAIIPSTQLGGGGVACFESVTFGNIDCVSWGSFSGDDSTFHAGPPASSIDAIPSGASIARRLDSGTKGELDFADDTNNSDADFKLASPSPEGGGTPQSIPRLTFPSTYTVSEGDDVVVQVQLDPPSGTPISALFKTKDATAIAPDDFTDADAELMFASNDVSEEVNVHTVDDDVFEGPERIHIKLRDPQGGALLGKLFGSEIFIEDFEDDETPPTSAITRPDNGHTYKPGKLMKLKGTSNDGPVSVLKVELALRKTMTDGSCRWLDGADFVSGSCSGKRFANKAHGKDNWTFALADPLPKSVGTQIKSYTLFSRARDHASHVEVDFEPGRNVSTFEVT